MPARTSCCSPAALLKVLLVISTSSRTGTPPRCPGFKWLHQQAFDDEHDRRETQGVGEQERDVEQLEGHADLEADAVRASEQFRYQYDFPDQRQSGSRRRRDIGRQLRQYHM